ncbi:MAG: CrcB family protein [Haloferacaceae archaeon]
MDRAAPLLVASGGGAGALARYAVALAVGSPAATLAVNVGGSLALGVLVARVPGRRVQLFVGTGLLSSFTTYSTFAAETVGLGPVGGGANVAATYLLGVTAAVLGLSVGRRWEGRR